MDDTLYPVKDNKRDVEIKDSTLYPSGENKLECELRLAEMTPVEFFFEKPESWRFRNVPKRIQTPEMVKFAVEHDGAALEYVSKKLITEEICKIAVMRDGKALGYVPEKFITEDLCKAAVVQTGKALRYVPEKYLTAELCEFAIENNGLAIQYVPNKWITSALAHKAVCYCYKLRNDYECYPIHFVPENIITEELICKSITYSPCSLKDIPDNYITDELLLQAVSGDGDALKYVPQSRISKQVIDAAIANAPSSIQFVPESKLTKEICEKAIQADPYVMEWIPEKHITREVCLSIIENPSEEESNKPIPFGLFPNKMRNDRAVIDALIKKIGAEIIIEWNNRLLQEIEKYGSSGIAKPLSKDTIDYLNSAIKPSKVYYLPQLTTTEVETPPPPSEATLIKAENGKAKKYDLTREKGRSSWTIYYITDIHLEHQVKEFVDRNGLSVENISHFIDGKIQEMLSEMKRTSDVLLIGGDVADTKELVSLFYDILSKFWHGQIISVLGNHELWDNHSEGIESGYISRPVDDIIQDYRERINKSDIKFSNWKGLRLLNIKSALLQNAIYIYYKGCNDCIIEESQILNASDEDLRDICSKSSRIILGGIGFSGLNQHYNAELGLYSSAVTTLEEDKALSSRFRFVYDKLNRCAGDMQVIVLTHTPVSNWTDDPCNPNWIYVNGHTHHNSFIHKRDGITVLSDNQVGYKPTRWKLNWFKVAAGYDPSDYIVECFKDGIHEISSEMYIEFYRAKGILMSNVLIYPGKTFVLKRNGFYMFVQRSESNLYLLEGGRKMRLDHNDIQYYYDNMETYCNKVLEAFAPYEQALQTIAEEIGRIGGDGTVHGCIVDINEVNHVYINPFDGKVTPYYAEDICSRLAYDDLPALLKAKLPQIYTTFREAYKNGEIPLLSQYAVSKKKVKETEKMTLATVPELVLGTEMYGPSRIMRSIQYIFDENIIRIWKDEILSADFTPKPSIEDPKMIDEESNEGEYQTVQMPIIPTRK